MSSNYSNIVRQDIIMSPRLMTREEYRAIKLMEWSKQRSFFILHLTKSGFEMYNKSPSEGRNGRWFSYCKIWELSQTSLFKAMNE